MAQGGVAYGNIGTDGDIFTLGDVIVQGNITINSVGDVGADEPREQDRGARRRMIRPFF